MKVSDLNKGKSTNQTQATLLGLFVFALLFFTPLFSVSAATLRTPPNNLGLVGYWSMEDGRGSTATDFSGNDNDGTLTNMDAETDWVDGNRGTALDFDGNDDYVDVSSISFGNSFTVSSWVKSTNTSVDEVVMSYNTGNDEGIRYDETGVRSGKSNAIKVKHQDSANNISRCETEADLQTTKWQHIVTSWSQSGGYKVYVDGNQVVCADELNNAGTPETPIVRIGEENGSGGHWNGKIDEVRVYNRELSASEVRDLYQSGYSQVNTSRKLEDIGGLVGWWTFDGSDVNWSAGTTTDASGNGNEGTLNGGMTNSQSATPGRVGQALEFDGGDDEVVVSSGSSLDLEENQTISFWAKGSAAVGDHQKYNDFEALTNGFEAAFNTEESDGTDYEFSTGNSSLSCKNHWCYYAMTYNGSQANIYVNGQVRATSSYSADIESGSVEVRVGSTGSWLTDDLLNGIGSNDFVKGITDDVRIYDQALTKDQIQRLYNATRPSPVNTSRTDRLTDGLVGFWSMNGQDVNLSDSSSEVKDVTSNNNHGDAQNGASPAIGKLGQGYAFDGDGDLVKAAGIYLPDQLTISGWIKREGGSGEEFQSIVSRWGVGNSYALVYDDSSNVLRLSIDNLSPSGRLEKSVNIEDNEWHYITGSWDGSKMYLYLDGSRIASQSASGTPDDNGKSLRIGYDGTGFGTAYWNGKIDNVRIYDRALSEDEIKQLYRLGK